MIGSERHKRLTELFIAASRLSPSERISFLSHSCAGDSDLRAELEAMLATEDEASGYLETPALGNDFRIYRPAGKQHTHGTLAK